MTISTDAPRAHPGKVFALAAGGVFLVSLDATIAVAAFPALIAEFTSSGPVLLSWVLNAYTIVYAALLAPAGRLSDVWGAKRLFLWGAALFTLASALCGLATGPYTLIAARALQAIGGACLTPVSLSLILAAFPPEKRARMVGAFSAVGALAAALGPAAWHGNPRVTYSLRNRPISFVRLCSIQLWAALATTVGTIVTPCAETGEDRLG